MPRGGIRKKIDNNGRGVREKCRSVPRGAPSPFFCWHHFFARCLTLLPRSLVLNHTETIAKQAITDRESSVALCHRVVLIKESVADRESGVTLCLGVALKKGSVAIQVTGVAPCHGVAFKTKMNDQS